MRVRWIWVLTAGAISTTLASLYALDRIASAQGLYATELNGLETWVVGVGGPQGPSLFVNSAMMRNSSAITVVSGTGAHTTNMTVNQSTLVWSGAAPTTWHITLPERPFDGQDVKVAAGTTLATRVTVVPANPNLLHTPFAAQTIDVGESVEFQYAKSNNTWYKIR